MIRTPIAPNTLLCAPTPSTLHFCSNSVQRPVDSVVVAPLLPQSHVWIVPPTVPIGKRTGSAHRHSTAVHRKNNTARRHAISVQRVADKPGTTRPRSVFPSKSVNILVLWLLVSFFFYLGFFLFLAQ
ncbi:unnamed protein product [Caenorhabditis brenneri]